MLMGLHGKTLAMPWRFMAPAATDRHGQYHGIAMNIVRGGYMGLPMYFHGLRDGVVMEMLRQCHDHNTNAIHSNPTTYGRAWL